MGEGLVSCKPLENLGTLMSTDTYERTPIGVGRVLSAYVELCKPRIAVLVLITATVGYVLGSTTFYVGPMVFLLAGVVLVASGASALNHYLERDIDPKMDRTQNRPIPAGIIPPSHALFFGTYTAIAGVMLLLWQVNLVTAFLGLMTAFLYVVVYTPMKRFTAWNTYVGAIPGALPILGGWTAATGHASLAAWVLFAIVFIWQLPHFYAIAWLYRDDYRKGGFKMLPVVAPDGRSTFAMSLLYCLALIPLALMPWYLGLASPVYAIGSVVLGMYFFAAGWRFSKSRSDVDARRMIRASIVYLPLLLILMVLT
jgi:protoheme IX farnesyltransferase